MRRLSLLLLIAIPSLSCGGDLRHLVREGDLIFQTSTSSQSQAIEIATRSPFSHVGIILFADKKPYVFEAIDPVAYTLLNEWIARGKEASFCIKRLRDDTRFTQDALFRIHTAARQFYKRPYDWHFGWSDDRLYCSELVWKIYKTAMDIELSQPKRLRDFDLNSSIVRTKLRERYGNDIPYDETVVSPSDIFDSAQLVTIYSGQK